MEGTIVRPVFFYNAPQAIGESLSLHLFEPRYRLMISRVCKTHKEFVYMGDGSYRATVGGTGLVCTITSCKILPDGRALLVGIFTSRVFVTAHWTEENSDNLSYVAGVRQLPGGLPWVDDMADARPAFEAFARAKMRQLVSANRRYLVTAKLPVFRELPVINADSTVTTGQMISSLEGGSQVHAEIIEPGPHESPLVLRARLLDPLQGFVIAATWQRELLSPTARHLDQFGGVRCTFSAASLSAVLVGGTPAELEVVRRAIVNSVPQACAPHLRIIGLPHEPNAVSLVQVCERLARILPPGASLSSHLVGLPVVGTFGIPLSLAVDARIDHVPEMVLPQRRMADLAHSWWQEYAMEVRVLAVTAPERVPFFVSVRVAAESSYLAHHACVLLSLPHATRMLRMLSARIHWPALRVVLVGVTDEASLMSLLPTEVVLRICQYVAPDAFTR